MKLDKQTIVTILILLTILLIGAAYLYYILVIPHVKDTAPLKSALIPSSEEASFTTLGGEEIELSEQFGKIIIVYSWASWCPQCHGDLVVLNDFASNVNPEKVQILAINRAEDKYAAERFLSTLPDLGNIDIILDPSDHLFTSIKGYAMPETIVFNREGEEEYRGRGALSKERLRETISALE